MSAISLSASNLSSLLMRSANLDTRTVFAFSAKLRRNQTTTGSAPVLGSVVLTNRARLIADLFPPPDTSRAGQTQLSKAQTTTTSSKSTLTANVAGMDLLEAPR